MGLDITAYSHLKHVGKHPIPVDDEEYCYDRGHINAFSYASFPLSFAGLEGADESYEIWGQSFIGGHCYVPTEETETLGFRAGSYAGYSYYRNLLSDTFINLLRDVSKLEDTGYWVTLEKQTHAQFYELVNFADNEGCIGPVAAEKLYHDHVNGREQFLAAHRDYIELYDEWTQAFDLARHDGLVQFH